MAGPGPYKPGKSNLSASRMNETDALSRRRFRAGPGLSITETGTDVRFDLLPDVIRGRSAGMEVRYGYVSSVLESASVQEVLVKFLAKRKVQAGVAPPRHVWVWEPDGDPRVAIVPPNFQGADFTKLVVAQFTATSPVVRCERIGGDWFLAFIPRWAFRTLPQGAQVTRCA